MRILFVVPDYYPSGGGTEKATMEIGTRLAKRNNHVFVLTKKSRIVSEAALNLTISRKFYSSGSTLWRLIKNFHILYKEIKSKYPDIIHLQSFSILTLQAGIIAKIFKVPILVYGRGSDVYIAEKLKRGTIIIRILLTISNFVTTLTYDMLMVLRKFKSIKQNHAIIPNGISEEYLGPQPEKKLLREKYGIKQQDFVISTVSVIRPIKGIDYLLMAFANPLINDGKTVIIVVGDGDYLDVLKEKCKVLSIENKVWFAGRRSSRETRAILSLSDLFVLPSLSESFGLVNLEAMACGLPVVATNVGGIPEIIKNGENGILVPPGDFDELARSIIYFKKNRQNLLKTGRINKIHVKNFSWNRVVDRLEEAYKQILQP